MAERNEFQDRFRDLRASLDELLEQADLLVRVLPDDPRQARGAIALLREMAERTRNDAEDLFESERSDLSPRQEEVLSLAAKGFLNKEIASVLRISERTVQFHLKEIFAKTSTDGRAGAVAYARRKGWIK